MLKQLFCKHEWEVIDTESFAKEIALYFYGCRKCGKTEMVSQTKRKVWEFKQGHKGATFRNKKEDNQW